MGFHCFAARASSLLLASCFAGLTLPAAAPAEVWSGTLRVLEPDYSNQSHRAHVHGAPRYALQTPTELLVVRPAKPVASTVEPNAAVRIDGVRRGNVLRADAVVGRPRRAAARQEDEWDPMRRTFLVVRIAFADKPAAEIASEERIRTELFTGPRSMRAYYQETTHGRMTLTGLKHPDGDVTAVYTLPGNGSGCEDNYTDWSAQAGKLAAADGWQTDGYSNPIYLMSGAADCGWGGIGTLGSSGAWATDTSSSLVSHEIGHNFGAGHSGILRCYDKPMIERHEEGEESEARSSRTQAEGSLLVPIAPSAHCEGSEYGNPFDIMGSGTGSFTVMNRSAADFWEKDQEQTIKASGEYTIAPISSRAGKTWVKVGYRVPAGYTDDDGVRNGIEWYTLEYRRPWGIFGNLSVTAPASTGLLIYKGFGNGTNTGYSNLLDMHAGQEPDYSDDYGDENYYDDDDYGRAASSGAESYNSGNSADYALQPGETFSDPETGVTFAVVSSGEQGLTYRVSYATPIDEQRPSRPDPLRAVLTGRTVALSWAPSTDNVGVVKYVVFRNGKRLGETPSTTWSDAPPWKRLSDDYRYRVRAVDAQFNYVDSKGARVSWPHEKLRLYATARKAGAKIVIKLRATGGLGRKRFSVACCANMANPAGFMKYRSGVTRWTTSLPAAKVAAYQGWVQVSVSDANGTDRSRMFRRFR